MEFHQHGIRLRDRRQQVSRPMSSVHNYCKLPRLPRCPSTRFKFRGLSAFGAQKFAKAGRLADEITPFVEFSYSLIDSCLLRVDSGRSSSRARRAYISQNSTVFKIRNLFVFLSEAISREPFGMPQNPSFLRGWRSSNLVATPTRPSPRQSPAPPPAGRARR